jgi:hypothetical protein
MDDEIREFARPFGRFMERTSEAAASCVHSRSVPSSTIVQFGLFPMEEGAARMAVLMRGPDEREGSNRPRARRMSRSASAVPSWSASRSGDRREHRYVGI